MAEAGDRDPPDAGREPEIRSAKRAAAESKPPTLADVAAEAGVSIATASRILAGLGGAPETVERVHEVAARINYRPSRIARSLRTHSSRTIGIIVTDIENPFYGRLVRAIEESSRIEGYASLLCNANFDVASVVAHMALLEEHRVDGVIISVAKLDVKSSPWLARHRLPIVLVDNPPAGLRAPAITSDNRLGGRLAVDHLLERGHRAIGHLTVTGQVLAARERLAGAADGMRWAGRAGELRVAEAARYDMEGGLKGMAAMLRRHPEITAVFAYNDLMALGAMEAIRRADLRVPDDVSVVGYDDIPMAEYAHPPLTTVRQSVEDMGHWAYGQLRSAISSREARDVTDGAPSDDRAPFVRLPVSMRVRGSTAPPRTKP